MNPMMLLAETVNGAAFDATAALELGKTIITWILNIIKGEPVLAAAFVIAVLVPAGFGIVGRVKSLSK